MQGIYKYVPETNHVSRVCSVVGGLYLQFVLHVMLLRPRNVFCTFTLAVSVTNIVDSSSVQCAESKYGLRIQFLALVVMIHEVWLNA